MINASKAGGSACGLSSCLAVGGVFAFGLIHDFLQEKVFRQQGYAFGWFMTLTELLGFVLLSQIQEYYENAQVPNRTSSSQNSFSKRKVWTYYLALTIVLALTQGCGSAALEHVNFPVKVVIKSSKLVPTMVLGLCVSRTSYSPAQYVAAVILCIGVASFTLVDSQVQPRFNALGMLLLIVAVFGDALTVNLQDRILRTLERSKSEMAAGVVFLYCLLTGELVSALRFCFDNPFVPGMLGVQAVSMYAGVYFYLALIKDYGGAVAISVTSCRKVFTIVLSFIVFAKPFSLGYIPAGIVTAFGVYLAYYSKH